MTGFFNRRVLYVGPDYTGSNGTCWRDALEDLGYEVTTINSETFLPEPATFLGRVARKVHGHPPFGAIGRLNDAVAFAYHRTQPAFTFYVKATCISAEVLEETAKGGPNFAFMNDDMFNPANQACFFWEGIERLQYIITTKSFNVREFQKAGAPLVAYLPNAYDPKVHYPVPPSASDSRVYAGDVALIGTFRLDRADFLSRLASFSREFKLNVWGGGWEKIRRIEHLHKRLRWRALAACVRGAELWGAKMGMAIQANRICLGLLNHDNRDGHTSRTFEIPACGGFMLAERTEEQRMLFEEDKEAVYFGSWDELLDKVRFYLAHEDARARIARAGYHKCVGFPNTYVDRARTAIALYQAHCSGTGAVIGPVFVV